MTEDREAYRAEIREAVRQMLRQEILNLSNADLLEKVIEWANTSGVAVEDLDKRRWLFEVAKQELNRRLTPWFKEESR